jgi:transcriptional regulator with XRE-family HTH domain
MAGEQAAAPFAPVLRQLREAAGLSLEELAGRSGLYVDVVSTLERGVRRPRPTTVRLLAYALDLPPGARRDAFLAAARAADRDWEGGPRRPGRSRRPVLAGATLLLLAAGAGLLLVLRAGQTAVGGEPLQVTGIRVQVGEGTLQHCPAATFTFRGAVEVGPGAGVLTYHWIRPDGSVGPSTSLQVPAGTSEVDVALRFRYQGRQPAQGEATLDVTGPSNVASAPAPVIYACP